MLKPLLSCPCRESSSLPLDAQRKLFNASTARCRKLSYEYTLFVPAMSRPPTSRLAYCSCGVTGLIVDEAARPCSVPRIFFPPSDRRKKVYQQLVVEYAIEAGLHKSEGEMKSEKSEGTESGTVTVVESGVKIRTNAPKGRSARKRRLLKMDEEISNILQKN